MIISTEKVGVWFEDWVSERDQLALLAAHTDLAPQTEWMPFDDERSAVVGVRPGLTGQGILAALDSLRAADGIYYAGPVVQAKPGFDALTTYEFYVNVDFDLPRDAIERLNAQYGVLTMEVNEYPGLGLTGYWLMVTKETGADALTMANLYNDALDGKGANPNFRPLYDIFAAEPNDPLFAPWGQLGQYYLDEIHVPEA